MKRLLNSDTVEKIIVIALAIGLVFGAACL